MRHLIVLALIVLAACTPISNKSAPKDGIEKIPAKLMIKSFTK